MPSMMPQEKDDRKLHFRSLPNLPYASLPLAGSNLYPLPRTSVSVTITVFGGLGLSGELSNLKTV